MSFMDDELPRRSYILADLDGTLCDVSLRLDHALARAWDQFHAVAADSAPLPAAELLRQMDFLYRFVYVTGRPEAYYLATRDWLNKYRLPQGPLLMRPTGDWRSDHELKPLLAQQHGFTPDRVLFVLDDREAVVDAWRAAGYLCLQPARGAY